MKSRLSNRKPPVLGLLLILLCGLSCWRLEGLMRSPAAFVKGTWYTITFYGLLAVALLALSALLLLLLEWIDLRFPARSDDPQV